MSGYIVMIMGLFMFTYCVIKKRLFFLQRNLIIIALTFERVTLCMFLLVKDKKKIPCTCLSEGTFVDRRSTPLNPVE